MLGVFVNVITVIIGSSVGLLFKKGIPERVSNAAMTGLGACTLYIGISGSLSGDNVLILIASVVLGAIVGTLLDIDGKINALAETVEARFHQKELVAAIDDGGISPRNIFVLRHRSVGQFNCIRQFRCRIFRPPEIFPWKKL